MVEKEKKTALSRAVGYLNDEISATVRDYLMRSRTSEADVNEIRLRAYGPMGVTVSGRNVSLGKCVGGEVMREIFKRVCGGAVFAHRDDVCSGFVTLEGGIRVGVSGQARYEGGRIVGVGEISALVFRIPGRECSFARELYAEWLLHRGGMLICSRAGEGKTTAIRSLSRMIGSGERPRRVVVVDERCEFDRSAYADAHVDILGGYKRALGVDIAIRTMSAEVVIVDEIGSREDAVALLGALGAGVEVIATAHADSLESALCRDYIRELVLGGLFKTACVIKRTGEDRSFSVESVDREGIKT